VSARKKITSRESETDFRALMASGCPALGLHLDREVVERLALYHEELGRWSRKINLIAKETTGRQIIENHFLDSLTLLTQLGDHVHLLDVGTGAGFPGLVCKAARPEITVTLVEPRLKRVSFLRHIIRTLKLDDVSVLACRIEDERLLPSSTSFTHITGRAVTDVGTFLTMVARLIKADTEIICMKGPKWRQELEAAAETIQAQNLLLVRTLQFELPFSGAQRSLLVLKILAKSV
jgi:16S rRNA (guanine527-N7)-methyltransferase